jgi:hypothetical protein
MDVQSMGHTFFWHFVVPAIQEIPEHAACEYIYLFAADGERNRDGGLIKHYKKMGFEFRDDLNVTKPAYDFCCYFMCQKFTSLRTGKNKFFRDYNKIEQPAEV